MEGTEAEKTEPGTTNSTPESTPTTPSSEPRRVSLTDVRRRLEAEKKRIANLRKNRIEAKNAPKALTPVKRKAERRNVGEVEVKKKKIEPIPKKTSEVVPRKKSLKSSSKSSPDPEVEETQDDVIEVSQTKPTPEPVASATPEPPVAADDSDCEELPLSALVALEKRDAEAGLPPDTEYTIGYRLEAKDFNEDWYPARVVEVDLDDREVLVHFERWSSRYDEWISMDSTRLRRPGPLSTPSTPSKPKSVAKPKAATSKPPPAMPAPAPVSEKPPHSSSARTFKVGDCVMASWSDSRKYPAKVLEVLEKDTYSVRFFDGFAKIIKGNRISLGRTGSVIEPETSVDVPPPLVPVYPVEEDIGSKADRRERKRKHTVTELFSLKRRPSPPSKPITPAARAAATPARTPSAATRALSVSTKASSSTKAPGSPAKASTSVPDGPPTTKRSKAKVQAPKLQSPGQEDLMLIKTLTGTALEAGKTKARGALGTPDLRRVRTLLPRARDEVVSQIEPPPPHNACTRATDSNIEPQPSQGILEGMKIEMEGDNFKCPNEGCGKLYRKENLLQMHIKHYHPELKSLLVVVPKVLDLAYARTVGDLPSTAVMPRHHAAASSQSTPAASSSAVRKNFTPQIVLKKSTKVGEKPEKPEKAEKPLVIELEKADPVLTPVHVERSPPPAPAPPPANLSPGKTGHIKTLLPVNRGTPKAADASREDGKAAEEVTSAPLSALQQALMSPPGQLSAMLASQSSVPPDQRSCFKSEGKSMFVSPSRGGASGSPRGRTREEKSPSKELVNCLCGIPDEDGLMIQCDLCMCWQHGACNMIETDDQVPDKYVCHICLHPARQRQSRKYAHDQDWLKEGVLPRMPIRRNQGKIVKTSTEQILKESHDVTAAIVHLQEVIHSLRVKINIAEKSDHPKLYLWSKRWEEEIKQEPSPVKAEAEEVKSGSQEEVKTQGEGKPEAPGKSEEGGSQEMKLSQGGSDDADLHPALKLPLSQSELEHLASTVENKLRATEEPPAAVKAPEPEAAIQPAACRLVLLEHIERLQSRLEAKLEELEAKLDALEARDPQLSSVEESENCPRTKETLRLLQRDLASITKISNYATSD